LRILEEKKVQFALLGLLLIKLVLLKISILQQNSKIFFD